MATASVYAVQMSASSRTILSNHLFVPLLICFYVENKIFTKNNY
jgi:hypothetical protein